MNIKQFDKTVAQNIFWKKLVPEGHVFKGFRAVSHPVRDAWYFDSFTEFEGQGYCTSGELQTADSHGLVTVTRKI